MENRADPDYQTITAFIQSVEEKLTSEHFKSVFKFRGYQSYIRQSNDLIDACDAATETGQCSLFSVRLLTAVWLATFYTSVGTWLKTTSGIVSPCTSTDGPFFPGVLSSLSGRKTSGSISAL